MTELIWVDYAILAVVGLSAAISVLRGFMKEALSLLGWIAALWCAVTFTNQVSALLESQISVPSLRQAVAFAAIFIGVLLVGAIVIYVVGQFVDKTGISGTDRMLGIIFGVGRGAVIVAILVLLASFTALPQDPWWRESVFIPHFEALAVEIQSLLPPEISQQFTT